MNYVYIVGCGNSETVKVGYTNRPGERLKQLQAGNPEPLHYVLLLEGIGPELEAYLHRRFKDKHYRGEWFNLTDAEIGEIAAFFYDAVVDPASVVDPAIEVTTTPGDWLRTKSAAGRFRKDYAAHPEKFRNRSVRDIAEEYGISIGVVSNIRNGR